MKAAFGRVEEVRAIASRQITRVVIELPIEHHVLATQLFHGQNVLLTLAPASMNVTGYGIHDSEAPPPPKQPAPEKGGPLCTLAGIWCKEIGFTKFLAAMHPTVFDNAEGRSMNPEELNAICVREICGVGSRRDLDSSPEAKAIFDAKIRRPYAEFREGVGQ